MNGDLTGWQSGATAPRDGSTFLWARWLPRTLDTKTRTLSERALEIDLVQGRQVSVYGCEDDCWTWVGRYTTRHNYEIKSGYWIPMPPVPVELD